MGNAHKAQARKRFTLTEMYALVEGVERFGYSWAQIRSHYEEQLKDRTQVREVPRMACTC